MDYILPLSCLDLSLWKTSVNMYPPVDYRHLWRCFRSPTAHGMALSARQLTSKISKSKNIKVDRVLVIFHSFVNGKMDEHLDENLDEH